MHIVMIKNLVVQEGDEYMAGSDLKNYIQSKKIEIMENMVNEIYDDQNYDYTEKELMQRVFEELITIENYCLKRGRF